jgi:hypothetical protein
MKVLLTIACMKAVAASYGVPEIDLWALLMQEGGRVGQVSHNTNGTVDIGPFQVNSIWVPTFARIWNLSGSDATFETLRDNACWNAAAGASIYALSLKNAHDRRTALGRYHSATPSLAAKYLAQLDKRFAQLQRDPAFNGEK